MKLALFHNPNSPKPFVGDEGTDKYCTDMVRISEWLDINFPPLTAESRQAQLARIDAAKDSLRKVYDDQVARINQQAESLQCSCLCPFDKKPGKHHSLLCPLNVEVVS